MTPSLQPRSSRSVPWCSPLPPCGLSAESVLPESSIGGAAHTTILPMYHSGHNYQLTPKELAWQGEDGRTPDLNQHAGGHSSGVDHHDDRVLAKEGIAGRLRDVGAGKGKLGDIPVFRRSNGERVAVELHNVLEGKVGLDVDLDDTHQVVTPGRLAGRNDAGDDGNVAGKAYGKGGPEVELTEHEHRGQGEHNHPTQDDQQPAPCHHQPTSPEGSHLVVRRPDLTLLCLQVQCLHGAPEVLKVVRTDATCMRNNQTCGGHAHVNASALQLCVQVLDVHPCRRPESRQCRSLVPGWRHDTEPMGRSLLTEAPGNPVTPSKSRRQSLRMDTVQGGAQRKDETRRYLGAGR